MFDKPQSVIRTGILHIALVVGGDALHHLSVAVIAGDLYGHAAELVLDVHAGERGSPLCRRSISFLSSFPVPPFVSFLVLGKPFLPPIPASTQNS